MNRRREAVPTLEAMEPRQLLSTIALNGSARGSERAITLSGGIADWMTVETHLSGVGEFGRLGKVRVSGAWDGSGTVRLANARGTLTLQLDMMSTPASGEGVNPFTIVGGTGAYRGDQGAGEMTIVLDHGGSRMPSRAERVAIRFTSALH